MAGVVDQFSDRRHDVLIKIAQDHPELLSHVKHAEIHNPATLPSTAFAWPDAGLFPVHEPQQAVLSKLYAVKQASHVPEEVMQRIDKALDLYDVELDWASTEKQAATQSSNFLLPQYQRLIFDKKAHAAPAAEALLSQSTRLKTASLATAATNFVKTAAKFQMTADEVPTDIWKYAGMTTCDAGVLLDWVEARAVACDSLEKRAMYDEMTRSIRENFPKTGVLNDRQELIKIAQALETADEAAELSHLWGTRLLDPLKTVFNMDKIASQMVNLAGTQVPLDKLMAIPPETFQEILGEDVLAQASVGGQLDPQQFAALLGTLPMDLQQLLVTQLGSYLR
jgi:hypothetical protein